MSWWHLNTQLDPHNLPPRQFLDLRMHLTSMYQFTDEPNDLHNNAGEFEGGADCVAMLEEYSFEWRTRHCLATYYYVCEIDHDDPWGKLKPYDPRHVISNKVTFWQV